MVGLSSHDSDITGVMALIPRSLGSADIRVSDGGFLVKPPLQPLTTNLAAEMHLDPGWGSSKVALTI